MRAPSWRHVSQPPMPVSRYPASPEARVPRPRGADAPPGGEAGHDVVVDQADDFEQLATALAAMARDLLAQDSLQGTLDRIVTHAIELVDGAELAGILVVRNAHVQTLTTSAEAVETSDRLQSELGEGPCFDAARRERNVYRIADLAETQQRWPRYVPRARELGIASMMGFLLYTDQDNLGALDLYSSQPGAFTERSEQIGWLLASHAAVALSSARHDSQLREAIATRGSIGEALGILMERFKLSEPQAFAMLKKASQDRNVKLVDIAHRVTTTGEAPTDDPR